MLNRATRNRGAGANNDEELILGSQAKTSGFVEVTRPSTPALSITDVPVALLKKGANVLGVGEGVTFSGKVVEADTVILEGTADGEIIARSVEISMSGSLTGTVNTENLIVAGVFSGDANVSGSLSVKSTGQVGGKVFYRKLAIEEGGIVIGTLEREKSKESLDTTSEKSVAMDSASGLQS